MSCRVDFKGCFPWLLAVLTAGMLATSGCDAQESTDSKHPDTYSAEPIEGWVVDADTNEPLEGVIVVAAWILYGWTMPGIKFDQVGTLELMESVTDESGRYSFPGWGPVKRPSKAVLTDYDPQLSFFKSEYDVRIVSNPFKSKIPTNSLRTSQWNGKTILLKKFEGDMKRYADRVRSFGDGPIESALEDCSWQKIPKTIMVLRRENRRLEQHGTRGVTVERILPLRGKADPCGARAFWNKTADQ